MAYTALSNTRSGMFVGLLNTLKLYKTRVYVSVLNRDLKWKVLS